MRLVLFIAALLLGTPALAAPCSPPQIVQGWGQSFPTGVTVKGFTYDQINTIMYVIFNTQQFYSYFKVPFGIAQAFTTTSTPDAFYNNQIANSYQQSVETELCGLILTEANGYLLSSGRQTPPTPTNRVLSTEGFIPITTQTGVDLAL